MRILIANPGSTSYKCKLYETDGMECLFQATVQRIGYDDGIIDYSFADGETVTLNRPFKDYSSAIECTLETLQTQFEIDSIVAVGF